MKRQANQHGSILVDAMIALIVLAVGIAAIAKLQGEFTRGSSDAQARNVALQLAQQKLDDLKTYNKIKASGQTWNSNVAWPTTRPYELIDDNQGGGALWGPSNRTTVGNTAYSISWQVSNYNWTTTNFYSIGTETVSTDINDIDYKKVVMTVTWVNYPTTAVQRVDLVGNIAKLSDFGSKALRGGTLTASGPQVTYNPGNAPDVIAINADGQSIETTLPEPALKKIASADYYYSQFETVTYANGIALREEEFLNINCDCKYPSGDETGLAYPIGRIIWHPNPDGGTADKTDLATYVNSYFHPPESKHQFISQTDSGRADFVGNRIIKVIGESAVGSSAQHPFCNICCRDHHDGDADGLAALNDSTITELTTVQVTGAYACNPGVDFAAAGNDQGDRARCADPWRPVTDYDGDTGDHKHYDAAGDEIEPGESGTYKESCRLKRVNGNFFVFQDWHLHGSTYVAAARAAFTPGAVNNILTQYRFYIGDYITQVTSNANNLPVTTLSNPATSYVWPTAGLSPPTTTRFIARGIYMDYLDSFTLSKINDTRINHRATFFENVAFNEINLTRLTDWQPACVKGANPDKGSVANQIVLGDSSYGGFVLTDDDNDPSTPSVPVAGSCVTDYDIRLAGTVSGINRGEVLYLNTAAFSLTDTMLLSNTGIVGTNQQIIEHTASVYPTVNDRSYDPTPVKYTYAISGSGTTTTTTGTTTTTAATTTTTTTIGSCTVTVNGTTSKGSVSGAKNANGTGSDPMTIISTPSGTCSISGSSNDGNYSCTPVGALTNGTNIIISGTHTTPASGTVTVDCNNSTTITLTGPSFITTN